MFSLFIALTGCSLPSGEVTPKPVILDPARATAWTRVDSLEVLCSENCRITDRKTLGDTEIVVFAVGDADQELALHHAGAWWNAQGTGMRAERGHHSPGGQTVDLASAKIEAGVLTLTAKSFSSSFSPGGGPSSNRRSASVVVCYLTDEVACDTQVVFSETCSSLDDGAAPRCTSEGVDPG